MKDIFQFIKENETRNEDDVTQEEFLEALLEIEEELDAFELEESVELDEATDFKSTFDDLKKGDTVKIKYGSSISKQQEGTFKVTFKSIVGKSKVGKITLVKQGEGAAKVKHYLYDRDGKVSMAMGDMGANMTRLVKESLDEKAPKMKGDWLKQERERNNKHDAAMGRTKTGRKKPTRTMTSTQKSLASMRGESVELNELSAEEKKLINTMYDKKGNLTPMGKKVMDHGKKNAVKESVELGEARAKQAVAGSKVQKLVTAHGLKFKGKVYKEIDMELVKINNNTQMVTFNIIHPREIFGNETNISFKALKRGPFMATDTSKINEVLDEASEEGKIRVIDLSDAHPNNRMGAKEKSGYQVQRMTKGKFVNQGKPYKKYADAKKVQQGTGQHSMQFEEISGTGYELYHKDFSGAMKHAYTHAKKKFGITVDSDEIDDKVAMGPRKPGNGKTNTYRLKGDKGNIQVQVYNRGGSKPFELNMYKESVELDESKWEYQDARGVTKTGSLSKTVERQGTDVSYIFKGDDGKTDVVSGSRLKKMKKIKESVRLREIDEAKTPELKGNPFKYYKKPANKKEAQSNVNFWHYVGMADNDEIEDMGKIPANYKSYAKSMKQDAQRELKKMNEAVEMVCEDCGCEPNQPQEGCECPNDNSDLNGDHWVVKGEDGMNESYVPEKLGVGDGMKAWIADFKKSDAPQFKGASVDKRRKMAYAAYMDAKRG